MWFKYTTNNLKQTKKFNLTKHGPAGRKPQLTYLSDVVHQDSSVGVTHGDFSSGRSPSDPVEGRVPVHGHAGGWDLTAKNTQHAILFHFLLSLPVSFKWEEQTA